MSRGVQLAGLRPGQVLQTRDRRKATISRIDPDGRIQGVVELLGACAWQADGRYVDAPCGAAGPLDLVTVTQGPTAAQRHASLAEMLDPANRSACCD